MDVELARQEWEEGRRRLEQRRSDPRRYELETRQVELVTDELRGRVGQTFTLEELASAYDGALDWARDALHAALPEGAPPPDTPAVTAAAFHAYARSASDYAP